MVGGKRARRKANEDKKQQKEDEISQVIPELDLGVLQRNKKRFKGALTVDAIRLQLEWHRRVNPKVVLPPGNLNGTCG